MFNIKNYDYDCTRKCRLLEHGNMITAALTKRSISDQQLAAYIAKCCCNFCDVLDKLGRSAVHLTASVARYAILEWLLNNGCIINGRDSESGSSPLHRALYYGNIDCAVLLLRYGACLDELDEDTRSASQNICLMSEIEDVPALNEVLVWGSNKNYNLGIGNDQNAETPQSLEYFRKANISIVKMALGTYHSVFLDKKRHLYAVGHGKGGRCGVANESSLPAPKKVKVPVKNSDEEIICLSVSRKHSLVLTNYSLVYACGLNEDFQLGMRESVEQLSNFREVVTLRDLNVTGLVGVIAREQHSIAYSKKSLYVWGTNLGQFGISMSTNPYIHVPKLMKLPSRSSIVLVEANNIATVVYIDENHILLYSRDKVKTLKTPNYEVLKSISIAGGDNKNSPKGSASGIKLLMLTISNVIYFWYENTLNFMRCTLSQIRLSQIDKIIHRLNEVLILSQGSVYRGKCNQMAIPTNKKKSNAKNFIDNWQDNDMNRTEISRYLMVRIDLQRLPHFDRAVDIFSNDDFSSFAVLQESQLKYFKAPTLQRTEYNFKKLYHDACETDAVHDVILHVDGSSFVAHKLILYARAPGLREDIRNHLDKHVYLKYPLLSAKMFEIILNYIYTNYLPTPDDIDNIRLSLGPDSPETKAQVCALFCGHVERFQLNELAMYLTSYINDEFFSSPPKTFFRFNRLRCHDFPELYDVRIICESDRELQVHKCMLVSRLEYFEMMFMHTWAEHSTINLSTVPIEYMEPIIDYLYSMDVENFRKQNYPETFLYNMIVFCDQFFIERLQEVCELLILDKITVRKCGEMYEFSNMYNCKMLKIGCLDFICQNLARVLRYGSIESCDPEALKCISTHYRNMFKDIFDYRMITPDSESIQDELLLSFVDDFAVDLDYRMDEETQQKAAKKQKELKSKQDVRMYEREAISSMMKKLNVDDNQPQSSSAGEKSQAVEGTEKLSVELQNESKSWLKVVDKKEQKRKLVETNPILGEEDKPEAKYVPISPKSSESKLRETPERDSPPPQASSSSADVTSPLQNKSYDLDLSQLIPQNQKLSQKQRKRLSSTSASTSTGGGATSWRPTPVVQPTAPVAIPNAWGVVPHSPSSSLTETMFSPPTGSAYDTSSFANMIRSQNTVASGSSQPEQSNSFSQILADERRQREQFDRMQHKSLALTQIEETAIDELREFYNADNIRDEHIIIERKNKPSTMNFSTWQKH